ncbi:GPW/gp25 family protein [Tistrella mobilis]|uniref:GPW/gp25 family protein n=1 Tax=Tistrella mobilis TaxID=171437 RepID=UPI003556F7B1
MAGMDAAAGGWLADLDHLRQSVRDILTTPIGSRVMLRDYGSRIFDLIDRPVDGALALDLYVAAAEALARWEPRLRVERLALAAVVPGRITLDIEGRYLPDGRAISLNGIIVT